ncbi:MAG: oxygenase MpaB family protein [Sandaracinaceae bacterium]
MVEPAPHAPPADFLYWHRLRHPTIRLARSAVRFALGFDPAPPDERVRAFAASYFDADPIAEAYVEEVGLERGPGAARRWFDASLSGPLPDGAPPSLGALLEDLKTPPDWLDSDAVERGARAFRRYGTSVFRFAGAITLQGYRESSVAKPLALTGAYSGASARRRFLETAQFWIDVSEPGGLEVGAPGWLAAARVRLMHVFVRQRILAHPEWDTPRWGLPINQGDATLTLMGGSFIPGFALRVMGYWPSVSEIEAMMHFWRYVGHLMGVRPDWYPADWREASQLVFVSLLKAAHGAGEDGRVLSQGYAKAFEPRAPGLRHRLEHRLHLGYTRFFLPASSYRDAGLPPAGIWALHPLLQAPFIFAAETARRTMGLDGLADRVARRARRKWLERERERPAAFTAVETMTR